MNREILNLIHVKIWTVKKDTFDASLKYLSSLPEHEWTVEDSWRKLCKCAAAIDLVLKFQQKIILKDIPDHEERRKFKSPIPDFLCQFMRQASLHKTFRDTQITKKQAMEFSDALRESFEEYSLEVMQSKTKVYIPVFGWRPNSNYSNNDTKLIHKIFRNLVIKKLDKSKRTIMKHVDSCLKRIGKAKRGKDDVILHELNNLGIVALRDISQNKDNLENNKYQKQEILDNCAKAHSQFLKKKDELTIHIPESQITDLEKILQIPNLKQEYTCSSKTEKKRLQKELERRKRSKKHSPTRPGLVSSKAYETKSRLLDSLINIGNTHQLVDQSNVRSLAKKIKTFGLVLNERHRVKQTFTSLVGHFDLDPTKPWSNATVNICDGCRFMFTASQLSLDVFMNPKNHTKTSMEIVACALSAKERKKFSKIVIKVRNLNFNRLECAASYLDSCMKCGKPNCYMLAEMTNCDESSRTSSSTGGSIASDSSSEKADKPDMKNRDTKELVRFMGRIVKGLSRKPRREHRCQQSQSYCVTQQLVENELNKPDELLEDILKLCSPKESKVVETEVILKENSFEVCKPLCFPDMRAIFYINFEESKNLLEHIRNDHIEVKVDSWINSSKSFASCKNLSFEIGESKSIYSLDEFSDDSESLSNGFESYSESGQNRYHMKATLHDLRKNRLYRLKFSIAGKSYTVIQPRNKRHQIVEFVHSLWRPSKVCFSYPIDPFQPQNFRILLRPDLNKCIEICRREASALECKNCYSDLDPESDSNSDCGSSEDLENMENFLIEVAHEYKAKATKWLRKSNKDEIGPSTGFQCMVERKINQYKSMLKQQSTAINIKYMLLMQLFVMKNPPFKSIDELLASSTTGLINSKCLNKFVELNHIPIPKNYSVFLVSITKFSQDHKMILLIGPPTTKNNIPFSPLFYEIESVKISRVVVLQKVVVTNDPSISLNETHLVPGKEYACFSLQKTLVHDIEVFSSLSQPAILYIPGKSPPRLILDIVSVEYVKLSVPSYSVVLPKATLQYFLLKENEKTFMRREFLGNTLTLSNLFSDTKYKVTYNTYEEGIFSWPAEFTYFCTSAAMPNPPVFIHVSLTVITLRLEKKSSNFEVEVYASDRWKKVLATKQIFVSIPLKTISGKYIRVRVKNQVGVLSEPSLSRKVSCVKEKEDLPIPITRNKLKSGDIILFRESDTGDEVKAINTSRNGPILTLSVIDVFKTRNILGDITKDSNLTNLIPGKLINRSIDLIFHSQVFRYKWIDEALR